MALLKDSTPLTAHRPGSLLLLGALAALVILLVAACGGEADGGSARPSATPAAPDTVVTMYSSPT